MEGGSPAPGLAGGGSEQVGVAGVGLAWRPHQTFKRRGNARDDVDVNRDGIRRPRFFGGRGPRDGFGTVRRPPQLYDVSGEPTQWDRQAAAQPQRPQLQVRRDGQVRRAGWKESPIKFPPNHVMHQLFSALGTRRFMFRVLPPGDAVTLESMSAFRLAQWNAIQIGMMVAPKQPQGVFALTGVTRAGVAALTEAGLEPAAVIDVGKTPHQSGHLDVWIRLEETRVEAGVLTMVAKLAGAIAGLDPRPLHWQQGAHAPNMIVPESGKRAYLIRYDGKRAPGTGPLLARARELVQRQREYAAQALEASWDPLSALAPLISENEDPGKVYRWQAEFVRRLGAADDEVIDRSVALAAFRAGAGEHRVRALLLNSPAVGRLRETTIARETAGLDPEVLQLGRKMRAEGVADGDLERAVKETHAAKAAARAAADGEVNLYISRIIDVVLLDPGLERAADAMLLRAERLAGLIDEAHEKRLAVRALRARTA
jgi:hypothetical protein